MMFINPAAPVGWTRVTTNDDALLRIVGSAAPSTGGSNGFVATFNSQTTTGNHTLSTAEVPSEGVLGTSNSQPLSSAGNGGGGTGGNGPDASVHTTGTGGAHNHPITTSIKYVDALVAKKN